MRLELEIIRIHDIQIHTKTYAHDHILYVDHRDLEELILQDKRIKSVEIHVVCPGDRVRVVNLLDVVEPRCKVDPLDTDFPGLIGRFRIAGTGRTRSLKGLTVLVSNPVTRRHYSGVLDMSGRCARLSRYGKMKHVSVIPYPANDVAERDFENAVKVAGLKAAIYLARAAENHSVDEVEVYELDIPYIRGQSDLPRVAYYYQLYSPQHDHHGIPDPCLYGFPAVNMFPTLLHPNEVLDGAVVAPYTLRALDTYSVQNHAVIKELYRRHGKELIFAGMVCGAANMEPRARSREAIQAANLVKNVLGAHGLVLTKVQGGMPHVDLTLVAEECEKLGIKTATYAEAFVTSGTLAESMLLSSETLDLVIVIGTMMERLELPLEAERILGGSPNAKIISSGSVDQRANDPVIQVEEFIIPGIHDHLGGANIKLAEY
jgi:hypothetical protein